MNKENYDGQYNENAVFERLYGFAMMLDGTDVISDENEEIAGEELFSENMSQEYVMASVKTLFEENMMNVHIRTLQFLEQLKPIEQMMYYRAVSDSIAIRKKLNNDCKIKLITPQEACEAMYKESEPCVLSICIECMRTDLRVLKRLLGYIRNNDFLLISDDFYSDGTDVHVCFKVQSGTGYYMSVEIIVRCPNEYEAENLMGTLSENESL